MGETGEVVGTRRSVKPGMVLDSVCIPRPFVELAPVLDERPAPTPDKGKELDDVDVPEVETAPASERDVVVVLVLVFPEDT